MKFEGLDFHSRRPFIPWYAKRKAWGKEMATIHDFVEDWIEMRSKLQRQLKLIETETNAVGSTTEATKIRIKKWIDELNDLLKEHANADRP